MPSDNEKELEKILERVREARTCDFRQYKKATLRRRLDRRMKLRNCSTLGEYRRLLDREPEEINLLISSLLIKVSSFFRDAPAWELLRTKILPQLVASKRAGEELRIWCAGCATGEEAYSVAILVAEILGSSVGSYPIKIFGTDVDLEALAVARRGVYPKEALVNVSEPMRRRWFQLTPQGFAVKKDIRRALVFGVNDLVSDAPISRLDLLLCRNVFIYLDGALQKKVLTRFHYAMRADGLLMLGRSELIPFAARIFEPVDLQRRVYRKQRREEMGGRGHERLLGYLHQGRASTDAGQGEPEAGYLTQVTRDILDSLMSPVFCAALDGTVIVWNQAAARLWGRSDDEALGKPVLSLSLTGLEDEFLVDRTALVRRGKSEREVAEVVVPGRSGDVTMTAEVSALRNSAGTCYGFIYRLQDLSAVRTMETDLRQANADRQAALHEAQSTNEELQSANEELETTNEELQSANEELQTTNEELQSINEELETTNEELQSTNAELDATNRELAFRTEELNLASFHQRTIIRSLSAAVVVLDAMGRITMWNLAAERLLGLPESEAVGQLLWSLRIPALKRAQLQRVRKSLSRSLALRFDNLPYELPQGGQGTAALAAVPISENGNYLGAVLIFEDCTKQANLAREIKEIRAEKGRTPTTGKAADGAARRRPRLTLIRGRRNPREG